MKKRDIIGSILLSTLLITAVPAISKEMRHGHSKKHHFTTKSASQLKSAISKQMAALSEIAPTLNPKVLKLALTAYTNAREKGIDDKQILTIVDYSKPDTAKRLWVFNVKEDTLLFNTLVAHGKNSGDVNATKFSNKPKSKESSLGLFLTQETYTGHHGYSLRLKGLSKGFNDTADERAVVMHSAWYVSEKFVQENHRLGRSWGCFALSKAVATPLIKKVKDGTLIFAYADNSHWLDNSTYLA